MILPILMRYRGLLVGGAGGVDDLVTMTAAFNVGIMMQMRMLMLSRRVKSRVVVDYHMLLGGGIVGSHASWKRPEASGD